MAVTLITGKNGTGKTLFVVAEMMRIALSREPRPLYVGGIRDLIIPHHKLPPFDQWVEMQPSQVDASRLVPMFKAFPPNSLIVLDEAQHYFPPRSNGSIVPPLVGAFDEHRFLGLDFILITQDPTFLDAHVRKLVKKHIAYRDAWNGRFSVEWDAVHDVDSKTDRAQGRESRVTLPKELYQLYFSSEKHTTLQRKKPKVLYIFLALLVLSPVLIVSAVLFVKKLGHHSSSAAAKNAIVISKDSEGNAIDADTATYLKKFKPRLIGNPSSAPLYDDLKKPVAWPRIAGAMKMRGKWKCYTQQGTDAGLTSAACEAWFNDTPFDPYNVSPYPAAPTIAQGQTPALEKRDVPKGNNGYSSDDNPDVEPTEQGVTLGDDADGMSIAQKLPKGTINADGSEAPLPIHDARPVAPIEPTRFIK